MTTTTGTGPGYTSTATATRPARETPQHDLTGDLVGRTYGLLTVVGRAPNTPADADEWRVDCDCGNARLMSRHELARHVDRYANQPFCGFRAAHRHAR